MMIGMGIGWQRPTVALMRLIHRVVAGLIEFNDISKLGCWT